MSVEKETAIDSILNTVKSFIGIPNESTDFDSDIIIFINMSLFALYQFGVGPTMPYIVIDSQNTWDEFLKDTGSNFNSCKAYVNLRTKLLFDPPQSQAVIGSYERAISELESRLNMQAERKVDENEQI